MIKNIYKCSVSNKLQSATQLAAKERTFAYDSSVCLQSTEMAYTQI